jgi:ketosteroid isomerase-like protein
LSAINPALTLCQRYIECVENKDLQGVEQTLADDVRQIFRHTKHVTDPGMFDQVSSGKRKGTIVAVMNGRKEVLAYTKGLMSNFRRIKWVGTEWKVSKSGKEVYLFGKGDMITEQSGKPYRNVYVTRFDLHEDRISEINEVGNAMLYMGLGIAPNATQARAFGRALLRPFGIGLR